MLNKIFLQGRLVADPELRHTQSGVAVATLRLAVDRDFKDRETGEKKADFINVVAWRQTAEFVSRYFTKGRMAIVEGKLQIRDYNDRDGNRRTAAEVQADNIYFGDSRREGEGGYGSYGGQSGYQSQAQSGYGQGGYSQPGYAPQQPAYNPPQNGGYSAAPAGGSPYAPPVSPGPDQFADLSDDDGDLPF